jgi:hypothetical protein
MVIVSAPPVECFSTSTRSAQDERWLGEARLRQSDVQARLSAALQQYKLAPLGSLPPRAML